MLAEAAREAALEEAAEIKASAGVLPPIHFIPASLTYSVPLFLKRPCDLTLPKARAGAAAMMAEAARAVALEEAAVARAEAEAAEGRRDGLLRKQDEAAAKVGCRY